MQTNTPKPVDLNASLSSLAMLSVQLREGKDYLDYIHGFVMDALSRVGSETFDAAIADRVAKGAFYLSGLMFAIVGVLALFGNVSGWFGVPAAAIGFFNLWAGFSGNTVEKWVKRWVAAKLSSYIG